MHEGGAKLTRGCHIPEPGGPVLAGRDEPLAVASNRHAGNAAVMHERRSERPAGGRFPESGLARRRPDRACRSGECLAIGAEHGVADAVTVGENRTDLAARQGVELACLTGFSNGTHQGPAAADDHALAIRTEPRRH